MKKCWCFFIVAFIGGGGLCAQQTEQGDSFLCAKITLEVKQLSQFFDRFNMRDTVWLKTGMEPSRFTNLLSLFNMRSGEFSKGTSFLEFVQDVNDCNYMLAVTDSDWYAIVDMIFLCKGVSKTIPLTMKYNHNSAGSSWVIAGVDLDSLGIKLKRENGFIDPVDNELNFIELSKIFKSKKDVLNYTNQNFRPDYLSIFISLVKTNYLIFSHVEQVHYHFLNIPGWIFKVDHFNRLDLNSGWLISEVFKATDSAKLNYNNSLLNR
jgi:hypothetical protein